jgi:hypothetical protein
MWLLLLLLLLLLPVCAAVPVRPLSSVPVLVAAPAPTPLPEHWRRSWGVSRVAVLRSLDGVFGAYGACEPWCSGGFRGACAADPLCRAAHWREYASPEAALLAFGAGVYLRGAASAAARRRWRVRNLSAYLSSAGCVTNLHWDGAAGLLAQTRGRKLVRLFAPGTMPDAAPRGSPCFRRSYQSGRACPAGACSELVLEEGSALLIPAGWAHHVTSLDDFTLGAVWRF